MIGSHNTFTYLPPLRWWMWLLTPFARCQKREPQPCLSVFDIRVRVHKGSIYVSHGLPRYCTLQLAICKIRKSKAALPICRLLLEGKFSEQDLETLRGILQDASDIHFTNGRHKKTWQKLLPELQDLQCDQYVASMNSTYGKLLPALWCLIHRRELKRRMAISRYQELITLFDFL